MTKQRDKSKKRNAILDAAVSAFEKCGYDRASMDHIAEEAQVSKRTIYNHFASKEILFSAVVERFLSASVEQQQIVYDSEQELAQQLKQFADLKINLASTKAQLNFMRMALGVVVTHPEISEQVMHTADTIENGLEAWLQAAVNDGQLSIEDVNLAAEVFWSMCTSSFVWMPLIRGQVEKTKTELLKQEFVLTFLARYQN